MISVTKGNDGTRLIKDPKDITVWGIYSALEPLSLAELFGIHPNPLPECAVGFRIYDLLTDSYEQLGDSLKTAMSHISLANILQRFYEKNPEKR